MPDLLEHREYLANAIAINSTMFNGARLINPANRKAFVIAFNDSFFT
ncbi:MAG: hypothetical protein N2235_22130 [Fischerella sp.]|nr:hypothetical protein [Fischerella sp.]